MCQVLHVFLDGATRLVPIIHREKSDTEALVCVEGDKERKRERELWAERESCVITPFIVLIVIGLYQQWFSF